MSVLKTTRAQLHRRLSKSKIRRLYQPGSQNASDAKGRSGKAVSVERIPFLLLPRKFKRGHWFFKCITRLGKWAIFLKRKNGAEPGTIIEGYEVVCIHRHPKDRILPSGKIIPKEKELYPGNKQWGTDGFSYPTLELAQTKFLSVTQKEGAKL